MSSFSIAEKQRPLSANTNAPIPLEGWPSVHVGDVMSTAVICVDSLTTVPEAHQLMKERQIRRLPVIDDGQLVGIVTLGDVRGALPSEVTTLNRTEQEYLMKQVKVSRIMHGDVLTVTPETTLVEAARLMVKRKIGGLPVVNTEGNVIGMVTESDIFNAFVKLFDTLEQV